MQNLLANKGIERLWLLARHRIFLIVFAVLSPTNYIGSRCYEHRIRLPVDVLRP
jgi:hypothetical protein